MGGGLSILRLSPDQCLAYACGRENQNNKDVAMLAAIKRYPHTVRLLLLTTFTLTVARALTLPYLVVYLADNFQLPISQIGLLIGGALIIASLLSLYGGHLVDTLRNHTLVSASTLLFALAFVGAVASRSALLFFLCLVLINLALTVVDIAAKAGFCALLPVEERAEVFAIKYTLSNVGYAAGPLLGVAMLELNDHMPFIASALLGLAMCLAYWRLGDRSLQASADKPAAGFGQVALGLARDRRLVCFTLGGVLPVHGLPVAVPGRHQQPDRGGAPGGLSGDHQRRNGDCPAVPDWPAYQPPAPDALVAGRHGPVHRRAAGLCVGRLGAGLVPGDAGVHPGRNHRDPRRVHVH